MNKTTFRREFLDLVKDVELDELSDDDIFEAIEEVFDALHQGERSATEHIRRLEIREELGA